MREIPDPPDVYEELAKRRIQEERDEGKKVVDTSVDRPNDSNLASTDEKVKK